MWFLGWLLLVLSRQQAAGATETAEQRVRSSPRAFSFEDVKVDGGILTAQTGVRTLAEIESCDCRARCLADHTCRGYGHSPKKAICMLSELLPTSKMNTSSEDWRWYARTGVRLLGERCTADLDCSLLVPGSSCVKNVCGCHGVVEEDGAGGCRKAGRFIEVKKHRLTSGLLSEVLETSLAACEITCAGNLRCVAFDFSASEGRCRMYSEGVTTDQPSFNSGEVRSFVWSFARADGTPPVSYQQVGNTFLRILPVDNGLRAADACFIDGSILFPEVTKDGLAPLKDYIDESRTTDYIWIGLEDMLEEEHYVTSDGRVATDIEWDEGQPKGFDRYDCGVINRKLFVHDGHCIRHSFNALCQYVGENLALQRPSWMNAQHSDYTPSNGNDGNVDTFMHTPTGRAYPTPTWTVDLVGPVQVTSVLYVARVDCCDHKGNRNRLTEIRVGSDPVKFDEQHSARCVWLEQPFVAQGYARLFRCEVPLTGRYVRLIRDKKITVDFAELAVFGNRLQEK